MKRRCRKIRNKENLRKKDKITNIIYSSYGVGCFIFIMQLFLAFFLIGDEYELGDICKLFDVSALYEYIWIIPVIIGTLVLVPYIIINIKRYTLKALLSIEDDEFFEEETEEENFVRIEEKMC